tara:strand:- start:11857 stop:12483 length:627 start_codon:yes stop_codon:yes gene_type:complete
MNLKTPYLKPIDYLDTTDVFFTSDFHIGHKNVIKFDNRPFDGVDEMSKTIIEKWNSVVSKNSIVYFLGDLSYKVKTDIVKKFVHQLNGDIRVIMGNHDWLNDLLKMDRFSDIQTAKRVVITDKDGNRTFFELSHYPHLVWNKHSRGAIHLHGHSHQNLVESDYGKNFYYKRKVIDVGCMGHDYTPLSFDDIMEIMKNKEIEEIDHHKV